MQHCALCIAQWAERVPKSAKEMHCEKSARKEFVILNVCTANVFFYSL